MNVEELSVKYKKFAEEGGPPHGLFTVRKVDHCNYRVDGLTGHPFTIGPRHVEMASRDHFGMLGQEVLEKVPCAATGCRRPYSAHESDTVLFLSLVRDLENKEASAALFAIKEDMMADKIDGVALVETPEKFRVKPAPERTVQD